MAMKEESFCMHVAREHYNLAHILIPYTQQLLS